MEYILANRIRTPDGTILQSYHRHDYKTHKDKNGEIYMVDGGLDYLRRNQCKEHAEELSVYSCDAHSTIREAFHWGTRGKSGRDALQWVPLKDLTTNHIRAIVETQNQIPYHIKKLFENELVYRDKK